VVTAIKSNTKSALNLRDEALFKQKAYVGGQWLDAQDGATSAVVNPANGETIGSVPALTSADARAAIDSAAAAFIKWRALTAKARGAILRRFYELTLENIDDLARIMTLEQGKTLKEARGEILYGASFLEWFGEEAKRAYGDIIPSYAPDRRLVVIKQPVGVVAAITPWNFPNAMITRKAAPALAAGCAIVIKPSNETPFSALALCVLAERAGVPAGVFNVITGDPRELGLELTTNPQVRKVSFTGSTRVGKILMAQSASTVKKVSLELGGNAPFIVFDDADVDAAVEGALQSKFRNSGQTCVCANRIYAQAQIYDQFVDKLSRRAAALKVGDGFDAATEQGPLISPAAIEKVERQLSDALNKGARVTAGGKRLPDLGGYFFQPTVVADVNAAMTVANEETFGPLAPIFKFETDRDAIQAANNTEFGLAAYLYSRDIGRVWRVAEELEYGMVAVNAGIMSTELAPFGGVKESGVGREGSKYGLDEFMELKYICMGGIDERASR